MSFTQTGMNPSGSTSIPPCTIPALMRNGSPAFTIGANFAHYYKNIGIGFTRLIAFYCSVQSGNMCLGIYNSNGSNGRPTTLLATTGSFAVPPTGYWAQALLGGGVNINESHYFAIACDNTTAAFKAFGTPTGSPLGSGGGGTDQWPGFGYYDTATPLSMPLPPVAMVSNAPGTLEAGVYMLAGLP